MAPGMRTRKDKMYGEAPVGKALGSPGIPRL